MIEYVIVDKAQFDEWRALGLYAHVSAVPIADRINFYSEGGDVMAFINTAYDEVYLIKTQYLTEVSV